MPMGLRRAASTATRRPGSTNITPIHTNVVPMGGGGPSAGPAGGPALPAPPPLTNTAEVNPAMQAALDRINQAQATASTAGPDPLLQEQVEELRRRRSTDTTDRAIARSEAAIRDRAEGQKVGLRRALGRIGAPASSVAKLELGVDGAAQRAAAGSSADISLGRERDLDQLAVAGQQIMSAPAQYKLQQQQLAANLLGLGASTAGNVANQNLADRSLGLQQWQTGNAANLNAAQFARDTESERFGQLLALLKLDPRFAAAV